VTLALAREKAAEARGHKFEDKDPLAVRDEARAARRLAAAMAMTFRQCAEAYIAAHEKGWKNEKHAAQWPSTLNAYAYPVFGDLPVASIDTALVMKAVEPIWSSKSETASRLRGRVEMVLDWAKVRGFRKGENPARWRGHLDKLLPRKSTVAEVEHHAALPFGQIAEFMIALRAPKGAAARGLEFAILTSARTNEILGAQWREIDFSTRTWIVPADRMKSKKEHRVPLSERALEILRSIKPETPKPEAPIFPSAQTGGRLSNMAFLMLLRRMGRGDLTAHGFRSTFRDWCAEATSFPSEVAEMALAHAVGNKVEAAYRRGDLFERRRALAEAWAAFCDASTRENVVDLQAAQR
jgi:integrase